jgi:hypothetical protein
MVVLLQIRPRRLDTPGLRGQVGLAGAVLACVTSAEGSGGGHLGGGAGAAGSAGPEGVEQLDGGLWGEILVVVIVDLDHGGVYTGTEALDLDEGEEAVGGSLSLLDSEVLLDGLDDDIGAAAAKLAGCLSERLSAKALATFCIYSPIVLNVSCAPKTGSHVCVGALALESHTVVHAWTKNLPTGVRLYIV